MFDRNLGNQYPSKKAMKNILLTVALLATLTTISMAGDVRKEKIVKKAKSASCEKGSGHACCLKKTCV